MNFSLPFEVFLRIGYHVDDLETLRALRAICRSAWRACEHLKPLKQYQFTPLYLEFDGWDRWSVHDAAEVRQRHNGADSWPVMENAHERGVLAVYRAQAFEEACGFVVRRIDVLRNANIYEKLVCDKNNNGFAWECYWKFQDH